MYAQPTPTPGPAIPAPLDEPAPRELLAAGPQFALDAFALLLALVPLAAIGWLEVTRHPAIPFIVVYAIPIAAHAWLRGGRPGWVLVLAATALGTHYTLRLDAVHGAPELVALHALGNFALFATLYGLIDRLRTQMAKLHAATDLYGRLAFRDRLTDLPNRTLLYDRLATAIATARRSQRKVALLFLDMDGFKPVNDRHGHKAGDRALKAVATRLLRAVREMDTVARVGGDEFAVLLAEIDDAADVEPVARKILAAIGEPIDLGNGSTATLGASIGIGVFPDNGMEIDRLVAVADDAMYASKARGRNCCTFSETRDGEGASEPWLVFTAAHEIGVAEVDRQHRNLVAMANRLNEAIRSGEAADHVAHLFEELLLYTRFHFATEERFMARYAYPARDEHHVLHGHLLEEIAHVRERMLPGNEIAVLQTIKDWLLDHIADADRDLGIFLQGRQVR